MNEELMAEVGRILDEAAGRVDAELDAELAALVVRVRGGLARAARVPLTRAEREVLGWLHEELVRLYGVLEGAL